VTTVRLLGRGEAWREVRLRKADELKKPEKSPPLQKAQRWGILKAVRNNDRFKSARHPSSQRSHRFYSLF